MADESLDEILSSATPAAMPESAPADTTTEQQPVPANDGTARDEHGRFAPKAPTATEATAQQPNAAEQEQSGTVPQQALHEAREGLRAERARADRLEQAILALQKPAATPVEPPKPVELWDDPDKWADSRLETKLTPLQEQLARTTLFYSNKEAVREHGAEAVTAAKAAMNDAIKSGAMNDVQVTAHLKKSMDPVGDIVTWHKAQVNQQRIGSDPDAFVQSELEKMLADPAKAAQLLARLNGAPAPVGKTPASVTRIPQSLSRLPGGHAEPVVGDESIEDILKSGRRRG